jgi:hypothetical protein
MREWGVGSGEWGVTINAAVCRKISYIEISYID